MFNFLHNKKNIFVEFTRMVEYSAQSSETPWSVSLFLPRLKPTVGRAWVSEEK